MQIEGLSQMMSLMAIGTIRPPNNAKISEKIIDIKDTDGDGAVGIEEFDKSEDKFKAIDTNSDGPINQDELFSHINENLQSLTQQPKMMGSFKHDSARIYEKILSKKDEDEDGTLSNSELNISEETFAAIDTNEDGVINSEEFKSHITDKVNSMISGLKNIGGKSNIGQMVNRIIGNKDENKDEDQEQSNPESDLFGGSFSEIDTNKDGYISHAELATWLAEKSESPKDLLNQIA
jgi:Ca2+-binding EF-hand superfamily protein